MVRGITPVRTARLVRGGGRKPTMCALRRSGVKSLPCERLDTPTSLPPNLSGPEVTAVLSPADLAVAATAASAAEHQSTLISLCTSYHLIISTGAYMHSYFIHVPLHSLHCPLVQEEQGTCAYCQGCRRRHRSCHDGAVANTSPPPAAQPRCRSPPAGSLAIRSGVPPRRCRRGGRATGPHIPPSPTPPLHIHTQPPVERPSYARSWSTVYHLRP